MVIHWVDILMANEINIQNGGSDGNDTHAKKKTRFHKLGTTDIMNNKSHKKRCYLLVINMIVNINQEN